MLGKTLLALIKIMFCNQNKEAKVKIAVPSCNNNFFLNKETIFSFYKFAKDPALVA